MQHAAERDRDDRAVREEGAELADPLAVGAAAAAHVDGVADLQDVAAVERARLLDPRDLEPELAHRRLGARDLGPALVRAGPREHRERRRTTTIVSSMNAESGSSSAAGASRISQPAPASAAT